VSDPELGLTSAEVEARVARGDVNDVPATPTRTVAGIVRANVFTRFNALLGAMLVIILIVGPFQDALFGIVLVANTAIGIVQELRAKRTLERLSVLTTPRVRVVRDGAVSEVDRQAVVLDDVIEASAGSQIVVDGDIVSADGLEVDESLVSGEADPVPKEPGDRVLSGSFVAAGIGRYRASRVGRDAYASQLIEDARRFTLTRSELRQGIDRILLYVTIAIIPTATLLFISQLRAQADRGHALSSAVAGTVAMIPEGLVLLTSLAFALAVMRLARRRVITQELQAVEGLARVDVLCIDKTGTLTEGRLSVERVEPMGDVDPAGPLAALAAHDPAPNATMRAIATAFPEPPPGWSPDETFPFSSSRRWSGATFGERGTWLLGAPEVLLGSDERPDRLGGLVGEGKRVLILSKGDVQAGAPRADDLEAVAVLVLADRVRPDAADTLRYFADERVRVRVLSGDHPETVGAIARGVGLDGEEAIDASALDDDPDVLIEALEEHAVFGRVSPERKRAMIRALQAAGHTVGMTGDGVNDVLALKDADIGIAMGGGSDATRGVAQLVLLDSSFDALPSVVLEGRRVLGNIERTSRLYLTKTVYAMLLALATGVLSFVFPFLPRHITLIGALTIGIPSFFLALAPTEDRFNPGFVGRVLRFAIPTGIVAGAATLVAYRFAIDVAGVSLAQGRTAAVLTLTWVGFAVLAVVAEPLTAWRVALLWGMAGLFVAIVALPATREFFALVLPPPIVWLAGIGIAAIAWWVAQAFVPRERPPDHPPHQT
jgi:cation-transporting P-type ATPase E